MHYVIGVGGGGSHLAPLLARLVGPRNIVLVDGDAVEEGNLNRQLFSAEDIGRNKAAALAERLPGATTIQHYYHADLIEHKAADWLWCNADNHPCRRAALECCDRFGCRAILSGNESEDAEAYYYEPRFRGTPADPRTYYPVVLTGTANDPRAPAGCTSDAAVAAQPQGLIANLAATVQSLQLWHYWVNVAPTEDPGTREYWPIRFWSTARTCGRQTVGG